MVHHPAKSISFHSISRVAAALILAFSLSEGAYAQQDQQGQQHGQQQDQQQADPKQQPPQDRPSNPTYASQDADKPPYSHDRPAQNAPAPQSQPAAPSQPSQSIPGTLTVPAGTVLLIRTNDFLSTDRNQVGDSFTAVLDQPLIVSGWVVARRGQVLVGKVKEVRQAGRIKGTSELGVVMAAATTV